MRTQIELCTAHVLQNVWRRLQSRDFYRKQPSTPVQVTPKIVLRNGENLMDGTVHHVVRRCIITLYPAIAQESAHTLVILSMQQHG